jgi:hypothetical protein
MEELASGKMGVTKWQCSYKLVGMYKLESEHMGISDRLCELVKKNRGLSEFECGS